MNVMLPIKKTSAKSEAFMDLKALILDPIKSREVANLEARLLLGKALKGVARHDNLCGAIDTFTSYFGLMAHVIEIHGAADPSLGDLRDKCRWYLDDIEAMSGEAICGTRTTL